MRWNIMVKINIELCYLDIDPWFGSYKIVKPFLILEDRYIEELFQVFIELIKGFR